MESINCFTDRAEYFSRFRPGYPDSIIGLLEKEIGFDEFKDVADIGSGTGMFSKIFVRNSNITFGVEPNDTMRQKAEKLLGKYFNFISIPGTAENTTLANESVDIITIAESFRWFDLEKAKTEFLRILRKDGYCILVYYQLKNDTPFMKEFNKMLNSLKHREQSDKKAIDKCIEDFYSPRKAKMKILSYEQELDFAGLKGLVLSYSIMPLEGELHKSALKNLKDIFDRNNLVGKVTIEYKIKIYFGKIK